MNSEESEGLYGDIQCLNGINEKQFREIVTIVMKTLIEKKNDLMDMIERYAHAQQLDLASLKFGIRGFFIVLKEGIKAGFNSQRIQNNFVHYGLTPSRATEIANLWDKYQSPLSQAIIDHTINVNHLEDFQWRFGVTASDSEHDKVGNAYMQFKLTLDKEDGSKENVHMERYQALPVRYMSPENEVVRRFLIYHSPGTGKSFTALWIILNFINVYIKPCIILVKSKEAIDEFSKRVKAWYSSIIHPYQMLKIM